MTLQRRSCTRFKVPGATLRYKKTRWLPGDSRYSEDYLPIIDFSRGGARFICGRRLRIGSKIVVIIHIPDEPFADPAGNSSGAPFDDETMLELLSTVRWVGSNPEPSYKYQIGISFNPYGSGKKYNPPELLEQLKKIETAMGIEAKAP